MLRNFSIRKRIFLILSFIFLISLVLVVSTGWYVLRQETIREAQEKTAIFSEAMRSSARYLSEEIRPAVLKVMPDHYIPEAMVGFQLQATVAKYIQETYPDYIFKAASPNPLNQENMTDEFETELVEKFDSGEITGQWEGFVERDGRSFYAVAKPMESFEGCMGCHGEIEDAPPDMVDKYGTRSGYDYELGEIVGARMIYVPTELALAEARKKLVYLSAGFSLFFLLALFLVDRFIVSSVVRPIEKIVDVATDISRGKMDREFEVKTNDEIKDLADAFKRMKVSLAKAMDILSK